MANQWFKFYGGEYLSDPKIERLSPIERSCWLTLLCMASMGKDGKIEFLTVESLLNRSGIQFDPYHPEEWEKALAVLVKFKNLKMIETTDEGEITIKNWEKRQEHNLTVAERVAKHRAKKVDVTTNVTNVTTEENRVEENRENTPAQSAELHIEDENSRPSRKDTMNANSEYEELCHWAEKRRGFPFVRKAKQYAALKAARLKDISKTRLKERWIQQEGEAWREGKIDWTTVVSSFDKQA